MKTSNPCISTRTSLLAVGILTVLATVAEAQAVTPPVTQWDLPAQPLADSLRAVAARTGSNILFERKLVADQSAPPLKTEASTDEALAQLLKGTGLTYRHLDEKTVTIQLASAQDTRPSTGSARQSTASNSLPKATTIEEIIVTGSQIRGIENNTAPLIVLSKEYIDASGFGTTAKLIESLPQNFALTNQSGVAIREVSSSREQGSGVNLRGIGEGTTLVLLNGRRLAPGFRSAAVDISALPLTAIERVEILTDGASALYSSDAVGGVVNFILRDDFEGAETRLRGGVADGTNEYRGSQAFGNSWDSGNALISMEYYKRDELLASERDFVPATALISGLSPEDESYSAILTGRQQLSGSVTLFADALYTQRDSVNRAGRRTFPNQNPAIVDNPQANATLGLEWQLGGDWQLEVSGTYGRNDLDVVRAPGNPSGNSFTSLFESQAAHTKVDGTLLKMPAGNLRIAMGADWRSDSYEDSNMLGSGVSLGTTDKDQIVRSAFVEAYVPLVSDLNAMAGVNSLELSVAGRYDDYSSFGSSFDPQVGLMWEPVNGLRLRARHGTSYKAPNLVDYSFRSNGGVAIRAADPAAVGGFSYQLQVTGTDVTGLTAQESESSSFGLEFLPDSIAGLSLSLNYYRIKYSDRIANPPVPVVALGNPGAYSSLFIRNPTIAQVNQFIDIARLGPVGFNPLNPLTSLPDPNFNPASVAVIVDARRRNLSAVDTNGLDFSGQYDFGVGEGRVALGLAATYILEVERQITTTSAPVDTVNTFNNPADLRMRSYASWQLKGWTTNLAVNYTGSYEDNRPIRPVPISSYTTVDARLAYSFADRFSSGFLSGFTVAASVQNLLDEDPPRTAVVDAVSDLGFDPTNANALGRLVSLEFTKTW